MSAIGVALGMVAAAAVSRPISALVVDGLNALDALSCVGTSVVVAVVAIGAAWIPAWRASRVTPVTLLRRD